MEGKEFTRIKSTPFDLLRQQKLKWDSNFLLHSDTEKPHGQAHSFS